MTQTMVQFYASALLAAYLSHNMLASTYADGNVYARVWPDHEAIYVKWRDNSGRWDAGVYVDVNSGELMAELPGLILDHWEA